MREILQMRVEIERKKKSACVLCGVQGNCVCDFDFHLR